jgi:hypothetical protein
MFPVSGFFLDYSLRKYSISDDFLIFPAEIWNIPKIDDDHNYLVLSINLFYLNSISDRFLMFLLSPPRRVTRRHARYREPQINWINNAIQRHPLLIAVRWRFFAKKFTQKFCALEFPPVRNPLLPSLSTRKDLLKTIKYELNFFSATSDPYLFFPNLINCF